MEARLEVEGQALGGSCRALQANEFGCSSCAAQLQSSVRVPKDVSRRLHGSQCGMRMH